MKKSIVLSLLVGLLAPMSAAADSYTSLWKKHEKAVRKDHPQTVLKILSEIREKAEKERAYGQLLKAQLETLQWKSDISMDSLESEVARLERSERAAVSGGNNVLAAVYESALGTIYANNPRRLENAEEKSAEYYRLSMSHPSELASAYSTGYEPFVVDGVDSKYYYDDMLHVIGMRANAYRQMHDYYAANGKREGACLTALELVRQDRKASDTGRLRKSKYVMSLDSLAREYDDLVVCGEIAIERYAYMENAEDVTAEDKMNYINYALAKWGAWPRMNILRNAQGRLTLPSFHASVGGELALPGKPRNVLVMALNNISELRIAATRLDVDGTTTLDPSDDKDYATLRRHVVPTEQPVTDVRHYFGLPAYKTVNDTLTLDGLRSGVYLVEMSADNASGVPVDRKLLRVCNLYPVIEALPGKRFRFAVLDATTGEAVPGAKIDVFTDDEGDEEKVTTYTCDSNGEVYIDDKGSFIDAYRVYSDSEKAFPRTPLRGSFYYNDRKADVEKTKIYTDRSIYRPGQTVHVAALAYSYSKDDYKGSAVAGKQMKLTLRDANMKEIASQTVTTDDYGMASTDFVLPQSGLTGSWTVRGDFGGEAYAAFSVEEYRRPTFTVDIEKATAKYAAGDTVSLRATARSFAGVPVQDARVAVKVVRRPAMFWRSSGADMRRETVMTDTVRTSSDGTFVIPVPIQVPDTYDDHPRRYYTFDVSADVTNASGETSHGEASLPYGDRPTILTCDIPAKTLVDSLRTVTFSYRNNAGEPIDGDVTYVIDSHRYTCKANTPATISREALTSARHRLTAVCGTDTLTTSFVTFSTADRRVPVETHDWFWTSAEQFPSDGGPIYIQVGSSDSIQHVVYTIVSGNKVIEDGRSDLRGELRTRELRYKKEWGDGVTLSVAWVKSGHSYKHSVRFMRPMEDTRLNMKWTTFRDRLTPGQRETWTLNISRPDGKPARAQLLATLYDKSLDEIRPHSISFRPYSTLNLPWLSWQGVYNQDLFAYCEKPMSFLSERPVDFSRFSDLGVFSCVRSWMNDYDMYGESCVAIGYGNRLMAKRAEGATLDAVEAPMAYSRVAATDERMDKGMAASSADEGEGRKPAEGKVRENLQETAFFYPGLTSDEKGNVSLKFTLPESVTTWQFYGLAHDKDMNNGLLSATTVAKKTVMVQPNVPRFVRSADRGVLSALVSNTSEKTASGVARLAFANPETGKEVYAQERKFSVKAGETKTADFDFDMSKIANDGLLICRVTATGKGFSDGEQHYLAVLPDKERVLNTVAFSQNGAGTLDIDLQKLFDVKDKANKLTVEYTNSPAWLMVQALPTMANPNGDNAISLVTAYYANRLGSHIMASNPAIKPTMELWRKEAASQQDGTSLQSALQRNADLRQVVLAETPWLMDADRETEQKSMLAGYFDESQLSYRLSDNLSRLRLLQGKDGSFSWWKGMAGSSYMTMAVLKTLVRLNHVVGEEPATRDVVDHAFAYMDKQMAHEVETMRKREAGGKDANVRPSETAVDYLYAVTLAGRKMQTQAKQNFDYLLAHLAGRSGEMTIYGKATAAVVFGKNKRTKEAEDLLESIRQYSVYREETGRYFDTQRAEYSWFDYRIPTEVAAIEALKTIQPSDRQTIGEMQRWLLQSKRTQAWDTPLNSVNAIYAFLDGNDVALTSDGGDNAILRLDGEQLTAKATAGLGYVKVARTGDGFKRLTVEKKTEGTSWGAVYAQFTQPTADVKDAAMGMSVVREVTRDGKPLSQDGVVLHVGDRVTVRLTITADRDYDFVQLSDRRAACLEPAGQLSGYACGYYCQPKDNATNYFFDRLAKGKHVVETTYYVDRVGTYRTGTCSAQCAYSPEFSARTRAVVLSVVE